MKKSDGILDSHPLHSAFLRKRGGEGGIRTPGTRHRYNGFRDRRVQPLCHLSALRLAGRNDAQRHRISSAGGPGRSSWSSSRERSSSNPPISSTRWLRRGSCTRFPSEPQKPAFGSGAPKTSAVDPGVHDRSRAHRARLEGHDHGRARPAASRRSRQPPRAIAKSSAWPRGSPDSRRVASAADDRSVGVRDDRADGSLSLPAGVRRQRERFRHPLGLIHLSKNTTAGMRPPSASVDFGAPTRTRTSNLLIRSQMLYPIKLWVREHCERSPTGRGGYQFPEGATGKESGMRAHIGPNPAPPRAAGPSVFPLSRLLFP